MNAQGFPLTSNLAASVGHGSGAAIRPTSAVGDLVDQLSDQGRGIVESIAGSPLVGVVVLCPSGRILYVNDLAARVLRYPDTRPADLVGQTLHDLFNPAWADEKLRIVQDAILTGTPKLVRTIWNGVQFVTLIRSLAPIDADPGRRVVIAMLHRVAGSVRETLASEAHAYLESSWVRLGPLNCLSSPELRVLALLGQGFSVREVSKQLFRAEKTIEFHRTTIHRKLNMRDRVELAQIAQRAGLTLADADRARL